MARVKGPNGLVLDLPELVAKGLVDEGRTGSYEHVRDEPKKSEKAAGNRSPAKKK